MDYLESLLLQEIDVRHSKYVVEVDYPMFIGGNVLVTAVLKTDSQLRLNDDVVDSKIGTNVVD